MKDCMLCFSRGSWCCDVCDDCIVRCSAYWDSATLLNCPCCGQGLPRTTCLRILDTRVNNSVREVVDIADMFRRISHIIEVDTKDTQLAIDVQLAHLWILNINRAGIDRHKIGASVHRVAILHDKLHRREEANRYYAEALELLDPLSDDHEKVSERLNLCEPSLRRSSRLRRATEANVEKTTDCVVCLETKPACGCQCTQGICAECIVHYNKQLDPEDATKCPTCKTKLSTEVIAQVMTSIHICVLARVERCSESLQLLAQMGEYHGFLEFATNAQLNHYYMLKIASVTVHGAGLSCHRVALLYDRLNLHERAKWFYERALEELHPFSDEHQLVTSRLRDKANRRSLRLQRISSQ